VLFSSTSGVGHIFPMLPLARAFVAGGHDVLWAAPGHALRFVGEGVPVVACGPDAATDRAIRDSVRIPAMDVPPPERAAYVFPRMFGAALTPPMLADLLPVAREWRPDVMVHEQGELASPLVAALQELPSLTHAFGGAVPAPLLADCAERLAETWAAHGLEVLPYAGCFGAPYVDICPPSVQSVPIGHIAEVQPIRPATARPANPQEPPLVYVTMGTVQNRALDLGPLARALARLPVQVLVAVGEDGDTDLGDLPDNVRVEPWVDQPQVLTTAAVVVSHAGSGTFLGALAQGVPQLCLPQAADQFRNSEGGTRAGAVRVLRPDQLGPEAVATEVAALLDGAVDDGVRRVAAEIAAMPSPDDVVGTLAERYGS